MFRVAYTVEGTWVLLRRHGWSCQEPVRLFCHRIPAAPHRPEAS
ncbi:winged helix-turn-helix domain-containing protein [Kitasatospora sp. NPDC052896]